MRAIVPAVGAVVLAATLATPASAADSITTFTVASGPLSTTAPAAVDLGSAASGSTISGALGPVTVTDGRGSLVGSWTATITALGDFTTGGGTPAETISNGAVSYWSGAAMGTTGAGVFTPGQLVPGAAQSLEAVRNAFALVGGAGGNSATGDPTVVVSVPSTAVAGTYTGTIRHSVS